MSWPSEAAIQRHASSTYFILSHRFLLYQLSFLSIINQEVHFVAPRLLDDMYTRHLLCLTLSYPFFSFFRLPRNGYSSPRRSNIYNRSHLERLHGYTTFLTSAFHLLYFFLFSMSTSCFYIFLLKLFAANVLSYNPLYFFCLSFFLSFVIFLPTHFKCRGL